MADFFGAPISGTGKRWKMKLAGRTQWAPATVRASQQGSGLLLCTSEIELSTVDN